MANPLPVIPLEYARASPRGRRAYKVFVASAVLGWVACIVTCLLIGFVSVESVLFAGPVIFAAGAAALVGGLWGRAAWLVVAGIGHCAVCVLFVALVNLLDWGPQDATRPFLFMGIAYCALSLPIAVLAAGGLRPAPR